MESMQLNTASLDQLSDELIIEIAKQLQSICDGNKCLAPLVLCSRRLNNIASPLLYRTFNQGWNEYAGLPILLRVVMEKPRIGAEVKRLVLNETGCEDLYYDEECLDMSGLSPQDLERCRAAIKSFELPIDKLAWMEDVERGSWDAVAALLLLFLPSLEEIAIESGGLVDSTFLNTVIYQMASNQTLGSSIHSLGHLSAFSTAYWDTETGMGIQVILPYCAMPSVTTVRAAMVSQRDYEEDPFLSPSHRYQVQNLRFDNSSIGGNSIKALLACFPSLRKFYYAHGGASIGYDDFLPEKFGEALAHLHGSLEELTLGEYDDYYGDEPRQPLGSLSKFKKLRCFKTNAGVLFSPEDSVKPQLFAILPASLETLVITACQEDIYPQLQKLINHAKQSLPLLKTIAIDIPNEHARTGDWQGIGPDGVHARAEELQKQIQFLKANPKIFSWKEDMNIPSWELERIQSNRPRGAELEVWRTNKRVEKELIAEYKEAGIDLRFDAFSSDERTAAPLPSFMSY